VVVLFGVYFSNDYDGTSNYNLTSIASLVSLNGFDALGYSPSVTPSSRSAFLSDFTFRQQPFSVVFFVKGRSRYDFEKRMGNLLNAFRQFEAFTPANRFIFTNQTNNSIFEVPVIVEDVYVQEQSGFSATVTVTGLRRTQGVFVGDMFTPIETTTSTSGLPKNVSISYPHSFPAPIRLTLVGPIAAGFSIRRTENLPLYDFTLTVGESIPSGEIVLIDYLTHPLEGLLPTYNIHYLSNPEIASSLVIRPPSVNGNTTNTFRLSGTSSAGIVRFEVYPMAWSIYE